MARTLIRVAGGELLVERTGDEPRVASHVRVHGPSAITAEGITTRARLTIDGEPLNPPPVVPTGGA